MIIYLHVKGFVGVAKLSLIERTHLVARNYRNMADGNASGLDFNAKLSESSEAGETFYKLFYEHLDKKRNVSSLHEFTFIHKGVCS